MAGSKTVVPVSGEQSLSHVKLARVVELLGSPNAVAEALGEQRSRITRWLSGVQLAPDCRAKVDGLEYVLSRLLDRTSPATARKWLHGINAHLGNRRPVDLIASHRVAEVVAAVEQSAADSFA